MGTPRRTPLVIAVDGPAASGKGTIARALAAHFGLPHLDTGALYRAVGLAMLRAGAPLDDPGVAADYARAFAPALLEDVALRHGETARAASIVSAHADVRAALVDRQRDFARQPGGAVLDGRDIGTVIIPDATAKLFVTAALDVRAVRRQAEAPERDLAEVRANLKDRDARDSARETAPMRPAGDAMLLETSKLDKAQAIAAAIKLVKGRIARR